ncbi:uncharacterized protein BDV17DRAFT_218188 [Aspergillus undulatus]|uniref:uncharacterized protein n=1 Tax=Aspergillus undulatus TaxID=1810928 RepID=UPI003CCCE559
MAFKLVVLLVACLLVVTSWADNNVESLDAGLDETDLEGYTHWYKANENVDAQGATWLVPRAEVATVTVTETVCGPIGPDGPTSSDNPTGESAPFVSIPETTLVTATGTEPTPAPTTEQPPDVSGTDFPPSAAEPTSVEPTTDGTSSDGQTTTLQTSSSTSGESTSADGSETPTVTSDSPTATDEPPLNVGFRQGGTSSLALAFALTFIRLVGF